MRRIRLVSPEEAQGRVKEIFRQIEEARGPGRVPNLMRAFANSAPILEWNWDRNVRLMKSGLLSPRVKDAIGLMMAALFKCHY
jgi:alkylhydroperoxidase family enzyme